MIVSAAAIGFAAIKSIPALRWISIAAFGQLLAFLLPKSFGRVADIEKRLKLLSNVGLAHNDVR